MADLLGSGQTFLEETPGIHRWVYREKYLFFVPKPLSPCCLHAQLWHWHAKTSHDGSYAPWWWQSSLQLTHLQTMPFRVALGVPNHRALGIAPGCGEKWGPHCTGLWLARQVLSSLSCVCCLQRRDFLRAWGGQRYWVVGNQNQGKSHCRGQSPL